MANVNKEAAALFQQAGAAFNDATTRLVGGVDAANQAAVTSDLQSVQSLVNQMLAQDAAALTPDATIHAHEVVDQINLELTYIQNHADPFAAKGINDIQRDIIDIVQGDATLAKLAGDGFSNLPPLSAAPAPYVMNDAQAAFLTQFDHDVTALGNEAIALAKAGGDVTAEISKLDAFAAFADQFSASQGGLYSARFDNEFRLDGNNGTIVHQLEVGLQNHDVALVTAAAQQLVGNAEDVSGNMVLASGAHLAPEPLDQQPKGPPAKDNHAPSPPKAVADDAGHKQDQHHADLQDLMQQVAAKAQQHAPRNADHSNHSDHGGGWLDHGHDAHANEHVTAHLHHGYDLHI